MKKAKINELTKLRSIANFQFDNRMGEILFPEEIEVTRSKRTGRIREIYLNSELLAVYRPRDGLLSLSLAGARRILEKNKDLPSKVVLEDIAVEFVSNGKSLFAKHVIESDVNIRPQDEVIIVNKKGDLIAVGRATLSGTEMLSFKKGIAVRVRSGINQ
jgi:7-cyano-7-deazaguanine tRNA-ribosyltransferase